MKCPFCEDSDFDLIGLKHHILRGYCEVYNSTPDISGKIRESWYNKEGGHEKSDSLRDNIPHDPPDGP
jgi:hypothetical protein